MPEVRDLSDALPDVPMDPITGVGVVASRNRAPTGYDVVSRADNALAIWELNNMGIWYRMGRVPRNHDSSQPVTPSSQVPASTPAPNLPRHISLTLPASFRGKSNNSRLDFEHQHSNLYAISDVLDTGGERHQNPVH
ncbi:Multivesicular body subunit 12B [Chelonia mydas]|uniref:Multivesicular body subunit 12B n=1 Tax=Chelonia mydas TaxID=8469 RepID=M7B9D3_CHEMY|nr:Multivesicular body subunit 12B [Chelonia mydas]